MIWSETGTLRVIRQLNFAIQNAKLPSGLVSVTVDEDGLVSVDPKFSVDVVLQYESGIRRWFHIMTFKAVESYATPEPTPVVYGLPVLIVHEISAETVIDAILKYLAREEGLAEQCKYPDGTTSGGINQETQSLYHLGLLLSPPD